MKKKIQIVPQIMWMAVFFTVTLNCLVYYGARALTAERLHYDLTNRMEEKIPFLPWTIVIYWGCYLFWIVNYAIGCRQEKEKAFRFMGADILAKLVCLFCFLLFPTTNVRPVIEGHSLGEEWMRLLYRVDAADNLFPSIHCLTSWFCVIAARGNEKIPKWYKGVSVLIAVSICVSTLTTKQHVIADVIAGVLLAEGSYFFAGKSGFAAWYADKVTALYEKAGGKWRTG
ncbi:MAG: phosphatase PAP2 family protein [Clostridium sp.]|nr:phosphatase PAP2 family protein [Clostridium sp.]